MLRTHHTTLERINNTSGAIRLNHSFELSITSSPTMTPDIIAENNIVISVVICTLVSVFLLAIISSTMYICLWKRNKEDKHRETSPDRTYSDHDGEMANSASLQNSLTPTVMIHTSDYAAAQPQETDQAKVSACRYTV